MQVVYRSLEKHGFSVGALHGDLDQRSRMAALDSFRNDSVQLLVCSDVAARGLDIPDVSHVINYDTPHHAEDYVHRIGRTGRAGKLGVALTIVTRADARAIEDIEKLIAQKIEWQAGGDAPVDEPAEAEEAPREHRGGRSRRAAAIAVAGSARTASRRSARRAAAQNAVAAAIHTTRRRSAKRAAAPNGSTAVVRKSGRRSAKPLASRSLVRKSRAANRGRRRRDARAATMTAKRASSGSATTCRVSCCARSGCRPSRFPPKRKTNRPTAVRRRQTLPPIVRRCGAQADVAGA